jgi:hypothetical protein
MGMRGRDRRRRVIGNLCPEFVDELPPPDELAVEVRRESR